MPPAWAVRLAPDPNRNVADKNVSFKTDFFITLTSEMISCTSQIVKRIARFIDSPKLRRERSHGIDAINAEQQYARMLLFSICFDENPLLCS
jgi:hypothetical protein